jgi:hypothetical protein
MGRGARVPALQAMRRPLAEHETERPGGWREMVRHAVQRALDPTRRPKRAERAQLARRETEVAARGGPGLPARGAEPE